MHKKLLLILALTILVALTLIGCSGSGGGSPCPSTLTILSIATGNVSVMKAGTNDWTGVQVGTELEVGDTIKTGEDSGAEITFFDGSTMDLEAGTQIEILSLNIACDTGVTTITLLQTIGTTISRITELLDPASSYEVETPTGVAAVRGSILRVQVIFGDPNYQDGTTLFTNLEGNISGSSQGVELPVPVGETCIIMANQSPDLIPHAEDDAATTDEDNPVTVAAPGVLNNDSDPDVGDTLAVTAVNTNGTIGNVTAWGADGSLTYDPNGQFEYLKAGDSTTDSFTYTVSDGRGGTDTATVTITINGVNDGPTGISLNNSTVAENQPPGTVVGDFSTADPDTGDTFTYSLVSGEGDNDNASFNITDSQLQTTASFDYETQNAYSIRVRTTDSGALYYEAAFNITVTNANDPPVAVADNATTLENTPVTIDVLNNDFDTDGDTLTVVSATNGTNGSVTNNGSNVTYTPALNFTGTDSFNYTVSDGNGGTDMATVNVDVIAPVVVIFPDEGTAYVGYEDTEGGDFDYNDFGMSMSIEEVYFDNCLHTISMTFESVIHLANDSHDIHILRTLSSNTTYNYTITRTTPAMGTETPEVMNVSGQGNFDVVLFDSDYYTLGDIVTINIEITNGCELYDPAPEPPRWDLAPVFAYYDPYRNTRTTDTEHHLGDWQPAVSPLPWPRGYDVPYILIVPVTGWEPPPESTTITDLYPDFDNYYRTGSPEDWF